MRYIVALLLGFLLSYQVSSQIIDETTARKLTTGFDVYTDFWMDRPDKIDQGVLNPGVNVFMLYNFFMGASNFSFSPGLSLGIHNFHNNALFVGNTETGENEMIRFSDLYGDMDFKKNKFSLTYLDMPLEFWFKANNEIKASIGFKVGILMQSKTKFRGDDYINESNEELKVKFINIGNVEDFRYGVQARFGWRFINVYGYYSLSTVFSEGRGPELYPISVGISVSPY